MIDVPKRHAYTGSQNTTRRRLKQTAQHGYRGLHEVRGGSLRSSNQAGLCALCAANLSWGSLNAVSLEYQEIKNMAYKLTGPLWTAIDSILAKA